MASQRPPSPPSACHPSGDFPASCKKLDPSLSSAMGVFEKFEDLLDVVVCLAALYFLSYTAIFLLFFFLLLPLAFIFEGFDEEEAPEAGTHIAGSIKS
ncbi:hypothetical protein JD844_026063 [Phrynosoma platyrhinos]|uniref:Uncharacterized protein n=1 Tax=Phrynosoma platyrhinos TaxID=52577 RepID=A0ABQ7SEG3_PHRPL|nr:hypothetical protein JD844_026063 [Phrynosoma platyrhinos]